MDCEKAYKEARERAKAFLGKGFRGEDLLVECVFPELKESEDERIRKAISYAICAAAHQDGTLINDVTKDEVFAYLERQKEQRPFSQEDFDAAKHEALWGEQQPAEWSEGDEAAFGDLMWCIEQARKSAKDENDMGNIWFAETWAKNRIKSLHPQPSSQPNTNHTIWHNAGEEKPTKLPIIHIWYHGNRVEAVVAHENISLQAELDDINFQPDDKWAYVEDLLNAHPHWKPSEEDFAELTRIRDSMPNNEWGNQAEGVLDELIDNLKKL